MFLMEKMHLLEIIKIKKIVVQEKLINIDKKKKKKYKEKK